MTSCRWLRVAILGALVAAVSTSPGAAHAIRVDAAQLVTISPFIVVGTVANSTVRWNQQHTLILTDYVFSVEQQLKGQLPQIVTLTIVGGLLDNLRHDTCLSSSLDTGARYVLFLDDPTAPSFSPLVGAGQGWVRQGPGLVGNQLDAEGTASPALSITNGPVAFDNFVKQLAAFILQVQQNPVDLPPWLLPGLENPALPHTTYDPTPDGSPGPDGAPTAAPPAPTPPPVASPHPVQVPMPQGQQPPVVPSNAHVVGKADLSVVFNAFPATASPWSPHDQWMMSKWNAFRADVFRVYTTPKPTFAFDNGRNDLAGWINDATLMAAFGRAWRPAELAVTFERYSAFSGKMIEADIALNPKYGWTVDDDAAIDATSSAWSFDDTMLHELGHAWGLRHPWETQNVWWDAVMNYAPKTDRRHSLFVDDVMGLGSAYGTSPHVDGILTLYSTSDDPNSNSASYVDNGFAPAAINQGATFSLSNTFKVEVPGTMPIAGNIDVYLTPNWRSWDSALYLETLSYPAPFSPITIYGGMVAGPIPIPPNTPPGLHYLFMNINDPADEDDSNDGDWTRRDTRLRVNSTNWLLDPTSYWQSFAGAIAPTGTWVFQFSGFPGTAYDFSVCVSDGGNASFSTVLQLFDPAGALIVDATGTCFPRSHILGWIPPAPGVYTLKLSGVSPESSWGPFTLQYRKTADDHAVSLLVDKRQQSGTVLLTWTGTQPTYDVERASRPDFADGVVIAQGVQGPSYDDATLDDGNIWFYRVR